MIAADQPANFPEEIIVAMSSVEDGSMKDGRELLTDDAVANRGAFLHGLGIAAVPAVHYASFETDDYCHYREAEPGFMPAVDGVSTNKRGLPILLPVADCVGTILYDPVQKAVMLSHLGRHSTEQFGGVKSVQYMHAQYGSRPEDLLVWLGPSPGEASYPLRAFGGRGFTDVLRSQLVETGVLPGNIEVSKVDTAVNSNYFSHSQFLKGEQATDGRYAIVVMLK